MLLFLDTEFTSLSDPAHARKLLSLALVVEDGRAQWYAEFDGWVLSDCDSWVMRYVVPPGRHCASGSPQCLAASKPRATPLSTTIFFYNYWVSAHPILTRSAMTWPR